MPLSRTKKARRPVLAGGATFNAPLPAPRRRLPGVTQQVLEDHPQQSWISLSRQIGLGETLHLSLRVVLPQVGHDCVRSS